MTKVVTSFRNTIRGSNGSGPDQDRHFVGPDLGPNCLQRLSADHKSGRQHGKSYWLFMLNELLYIVNVVMQCPYGFYHVDDKQ